MYGFHHGLVDRHCARRSRGRSTKQQLRTGVDGEGRFIGPLAVDRGWRHFWNARHRRAQAPMERGLRDDFGSAKVGRQVEALAVPHANKGVPRASKHGLTADDLRRMWAMRSTHARAQIAAAFGVPESTVYYHFAPSVAMRCALAGFTVATP